MAEPNILLTRIDNRLVHGQVATQWNSTLGSNLILVANDDVSTNTMRQNLMKMAAPPASLRVSSPAEDHRRHWQGEPGARRSSSWPETPEDVLYARQGRCAYKEGKHRQHAHVGRKAPSRHLRRS